MLIECISIHILKEEEARRVVTLDSATAFGVLIRKVRKAQRLTQSELAGASGVGLRFVVDLEKGKPTCELEKALRVAAMLGIRLIVQEPLGQELETQSDA
jgi:y4mF family transcriptional regulator